MASGFYGPSFCSSRTRGHSCFSARIGAVAALLSLLAGVPVVIEFLKTGLVPRFPTAILATGLMLIAVLCMFAGAILDSVARGRRESKRLFYLGFPAVGP